MDPDYQGCIGSVGARGLQGLPSNYIAPPVRDSQQVAIDQLTRTVDRLSAAIKVLTKE